MKILLTALMIGFWQAGSLLAEETRESLIAQIELAGQNEYKDERHAVEVNDCQLTTYRWKHLEDEGWVLWTSFEFPMLLVDLSEFTTDGGLRHYFFIEGSPGDVIIVFNAKDGFEFTHEKPFHRPHKGEIEPSPRGDGTTHYFEKKPSGYISHTGPDVEQKACLFTSGYHRYVQTYCAFIG